MLQQSNIFSRCKSFKSLLYLHNDFPDPREVRQSKCVEWISRLYLIMSMQLLSLLVRGKTQDMGNCCNLSEVVVWHIYRSAWTAGCFLSSSFMSGFPSLVNSCSSKEQSSRSCDPWGRQDHLEPAVGLTLLTWASQWHSVRILHNSYQGPVVIGKLQMFGIMAVSRILFLLFLWIV